MATELKDAVIGVDVGGTTTDIGLVTRDGSVQLVDTMSSSDYRGRDFIEQMAVRLDILKRSAPSYNLNLLGAGIGMPNPFDYETGVSLMKHKFADLYNQNVRDLLTPRFPLPIYFLNDANAFGMGVAWMEYPNEPKLLCVTLGTGLGSGFFVNGELATDGEGVPNGGEIWNLPYDINRILEDVVSRKFIEQRFAAFTGEQLQVIDIAKLARTGHHEAKETFLTFGVYLGEALKIASRGFDPTRIVLGGGISGAFDLFDEMAQERFTVSMVKDVQITKARTPYLPVIGAAKYAFNKFPQD